MEFKGTRGDWMAVGDKWITIESSVKNETSTLPTIATINSTFRGNEEAQANARLIAAAPKLLEALEAAINGLEWRKDAPPTAFDKADDEKLHEWKELISQIL